MRVALARVGWLAGSSAPSDLASLSRQPLPRHVPVLDATARTARRRHQGRRVLLLPRPERQQHQSRVADAWPARARSTSPSSCGCSSSGARDNPVMKPLAATLSDQDISDLAVYYEAQTPAGLEADPSYWKAGQALYLHGDPARERSRVHRLPRPGGPRQPRGRLPGAARAAVRLRRQAAQGLCQRRALRRPRTRQPRAATAS